MSLTDGLFGMDKQAWLNLITGSIVSIVVSVLIYQLQKAPKTLDYTIRSMQYLTAKKDSPLRKRIEIRWKGKGEVRQELAEARTLEEPRIFNYHIRNTGKRAIDMVDFRGPIKIEATSGSIVDVVVTNVSHTGILDLGSIPPGDTWAFSPALMNPNDWIDIEVLTDNCPDPPNLSCWIREESRSMEKQETLPDSRPRKKTRRKWQLRPEQRLAYLIGATNVILALVLTFYYWLK